MSVKTSKRRSNQPCRPQPAGDSACVWSCAASSFAFLALLVRFAARRNRVFDNFRENAYGVHLVHYAFVSRLQLALLKAHLSALAKGALVFVGRVTSELGSGGASAPHFP